MSHRAKRKAAPIAASKGDASRAKRDATPIATSKPAAPSTSDGAALSVGDAAGDNSSAGDIAARLAELEARFQSELERQKLAALAEFSAGAGHEINNPLAVISGRAQLLLRSETHPDRRRELAVIHAQALRVHEMIADLMLFARPPAPVRKHVAVPALFDDLVAQYGAQAATRGITLAVTSPPDLKAWADPDQLGAALRALLDNAMYALSDGDRIELAAALVNGGIEFRVSDNGPGISPEVREHLFDPFYSGRSAGRGLGMGLAKCWRIAELHGGSIAVDSSPGNGATFQLTLPIVSAS